MQSEETPSVKPTAEAIGSAGAVPTKLATGTPTTAWVTPTYPQLPSALPTRSAESSAVSTRSPTGAPAVTADRSGGTVPQAGGVSAGVGRWTCGSTVLVALGVAFGVAGVS